MIGLFVTRALKNHLKATFCVTQAIANHLKATREREARLSRVELENLKLRKELADIAERNASRVKHNRAW